MEDTFSKLATVDSKRYVELSLAKTAFEQEREKIEQAMAEERGISIRELRDNMAYLGERDVKALEQAATALAHVHARTARSLLYLLYHINQSGVYRLSSQEYTSLWEWAQANISDAITSDYARRLCQSVEIILMDVWRSMYMTKEGEEIAVEDVISRAPMRALKEMYTVYELAEHDDREAMIREMVSTERGKLNRLNDIKDQVMGYSTPLEAPSIYYRWLGDGTVEVKMILTDDQRQYLEARLGKDFTSQTHLYEPSGDA